MNYFNKRKSVLFYITFLVYLTIVLFLLCSFNNKTNAYTKNKNVRYVLSSYGEKYEYEDNIISAINPYQDDITNEGYVYLRIAGDYTFIYDNKIEVIKVYEKKPEDNLSYSSEFEDKYSVGEAIIFPFLKVQSLIKKETNYNYNLIIEFNNQIIAEIKDEDISNGFIFKNAGDYKIRYSYIDCFGEENYTDYKLINVVDNKIIIYNNNLDSLIAGKTYSFEDCYGFYKSNKYPLRKFYSVNNQEKIEFENFFVPTIEGNYVIYLESDIEDEKITKEIYLNLIYDSKSLFTNSYGLNRIENKVDFLSNIEDFSPIKGKSGTQIVNDLNGAYTYYNDIIDLNKVNGDIINFTVQNTKNSNLTQIKISLIDAYDSTNSISVVWRDSTYSADASFVVCEYNGIRIGLDNSGKKYNSNGAIAYRNNFLYQFTSNKNARSYPFNFRYDINSNSIFYTVPYQGVLTTYKIICFDDTMLGDNVWKGFTTGEIILKIEFIEGQGNIVIYNIGNQILTDFNNTFFDMHHSLLFGNKIDINNLYDGAINYKFHIPNTYINDFNKLDDLNIELYSPNGENITECIDNDNNFIPLVKGKYTIKYTFYDVFNIKRSNQYFFNVNEKPNDILINYEIQKNLKIRDSFIIPNIEIIGGSGEKTIELKVEYGNQVMNVKSGNLVLLDQDEDLFLNVKIIDEIGFVFEDKIKVDFSTDVIYFNVQELPQSFLGGQTIILPQAEVINYSDISEDLNYIIKVDNKLITDNLYNVPNESKNISIDYILNQDSDKEQVIHFDRFIIKNDINSVEDIIIKDNSVKNVNEFRFGSAFEFISSGTIRLPFPVATNNLKISFAFLAEEKNNFSSVKFILHDSLNYNKKINFVIKNCFDNPKLYINGNESVNEIEVIKDVYREDMYVDKEYLKYSFIFNDFYKNLQNSSEFVLGKIYNWDEPCDLEKFDKFTNASAYFEIGLDDVVSKSTLILQQVSNQYFRKNQFENGDKQAPDISFNEYMTNKSVSYGSNINLPKPFAYDVITGIGVSSINVRTPSGQVLNDYNIIFNLYGEYIIDYNLKDVNNNQTTYRYVFTVVDEEAPQIIVDFSDLKREIKLGSYIKIPDYQVSDNISEGLSSFIVIIQPDSKMVIVKPGDKISLSEKSVYTLCYVVIDASGNMANESFNVNVI